MRRRGAIRRRAALVVVALWSLSVASWLDSGAAGAHPLAPSLFRLTVGDEGTVEVLWRTPSVRPIGAELTPSLPARCRPLTSPRVEVTADRSALEQRWRVDCGRDGLEGGAVTVSGLDTTATNVVVEVVRGDGASVRGLLHRGHATFVVPAAQGSGAVFLDYLRLGVEHLLSGPDHVLFVIGLLLLIRATRRLVQAITAFTLGHSVSLALSALGVVRVPQAPVEVAIAATIIVLALDLVRARREMGPGPVTKWPWAVCSLFGLLHGLGFAGALAHTGLSEHAIPLSLFAFNVGLELGQLLIVGLSLAFWRATKSRLRPLIARHDQIPAYAIGSLAAFWVLERTLAIFGA